MSSRRGIVAVPAILLLMCVACSPMAGPAREPSLKWIVRDAARLPAAVANNAVAAARVDGRDLVFSFLGLGAGGDYRAITRAAYQFDMAARTWVGIPDVPGRVGRIAATAQALGGRVYVFGGYEVAADGTETTSPAVDIYDIRARRYLRGSDAPVPVDDSVSGVWRGRLVLLIGGWSTAHNVVAVQAYDPARDTWSAASPMIGTPVFGHSGGIVRDVIVYCDGATEQAPLTPKYVLTDECYRGDIDPSAPTRIGWRRVARHPGPPRYRMAAGAIDAGGIVGVLFVGGTTNPYNYNGIGYDGRPSEPEATGWIYDVVGDRWMDGPILATATMDHRGLANLNGRWFIVGGLGPRQQVLAGTVQISLAGGR